jgi:FkbM family methyltransferase
MFHSFVRAIFYNSAAVHSDLSRDLPAKWLELNSLRRFLRDHRINVVIDVGANEGQFVSKLRRLSFRGRIVSFEPDPRTYTIMREHHGKDSSWRGYPIALGEADTEGVLHQAKESVLSSFLTPVRRESISSDVRVPVRRLDDVFDEVIVGLPEPRVLLKTDTQGFDLQVLRGATQSLNRIGGILAEISVLPIYENIPRIDQALSAYRQAGFDLLDLSVVNRTPDGRILEFDGLFVRRVAKSEAVSW